MLFIRSISYCLEQIQTYFNYQLSCDDYETHLAQKFSYQLGTTITAKLPSELLSEAPVQYRRSGEPVEIIAPLATQLAVMHLNTSTSPVMGEAFLQVKNDEAKGKEKAQEALQPAEEDMLQDDQSKPLLVESSHQEQSELEHDWTNIPLAGVGIIKERSFYQNPLQVSTFVDDIPLRFGVTWRQIVHSTYDDFIKILANNLKQESLTDVKMLVLARYARQLQIIKAWGTKILDARDQSLKALALGSHNVSQKENILSVEKERQKFLKQPVDAWLVELTSIAREEALLLLRSALASYKVKVGFGVEFSHSEGDSEDMINACNHTIMQFFLCMKQHDASEKNVQMQDVFPSQLNAPDAIIMSFMSLTHYLSQNWFTEGMFLAHKQRGTYCRSDQYTFDPEKTIAKRRSVLDLMSKLESQLPPLCQTPNIYWGKALTLVDDAVRDSAYLSSKGFFSGWTVNSDRLPKTYQALHTQFVEQADQKTDNVASKHRACKFW